MQSDLRRPALRPLFTRLLSVPAALLCANLAQAANVDAECAAIYGSNFVASTGQVAAVMPSLARPLKGVTFRDPSFRTCVIRATDHAVEAPTNFARSDYARRQAFNVDNTFFIAYASGGGWHLYDANTSAWVKQLSGMSGDAEPQWHPTDPKSLYYVPSKGGLSLKRLNIDTNVTTIAADFTSRLPWSTAARVWTHNEGSPSADGRYWCFIAETSTAGILGVFSYDLVNQQVLGSKTLTASPNHVSMTPSGRSCVISGTTAWNRTFTTSRTLLNGSQHNDLALGLDGDDYYVFTDHGGNGYVSMVNIDTGVRTNLVPTWNNGTTTSMHISAKSFQRPGWVLLSTFNHSGAENWLHERVMAVEMKASPKIINLAHHHTYYNGYWTQPHATVSRDFTRVLFSSNWGSTSNMDVDAYLIRLPNDLFGATTPPAPPPPPPDTQAPSVTASVAGTAGIIGLGASATDNVAIKSVEFMVDGVLKGSDTTAPYSLSLDSLALANGNHSLVAIAYDTSANAGQSAAVAFTVSNVIASTDTVAPTVSASTSVVRGSVTLRAQATDDVGVTKVEFHVDGAIKGTDTGSPYALTVDTRTWVAGSTHTLVAKAYDAAGNERASAPVSFKIPKHNGVLTK